MQIKPWLIVDDSYMLRCLEDLAKGLSNLHYPTPRSTLLPTGLPVQYPSDGGFVANTRWKLTAILTESKYTGKPAHTLMEVLIPAAINGFFW